MSAVAEFVQPGRILDCTETEYHADPCASPSLNQTTANVLLKQSPLHAWTQHPRFGNQINDGDEDEDDDGNEKKDTDATRSGKVIHKLLLGKGCDIEVIEVDAYRTKVAKAQRDDAIAAGRVPMKARKYAELLDASEAIRENLKLEGVDLCDEGGESEIAVEFYEDGEHGPVACRARLDRSNVRRGTIRELKSIRSADDETCSKHAASYGYDVQFASNTRALSALRPDLEGRVDMQFAFFEIEPPYAVNVFRPSKVMQIIGLQEWERAVLLWEQCLRTNRWPGYGGRAGELDLPHWYVTKKLGDWQGTDVTDLALER